jgi:hypothetical protein
MPWGLALLGTRYPCTSPRQASARAAQGLPVCPALHAAPPPPCPRRDTEAKFVYGNKAALALFECTWDELVGTPSTQSAEPVDEVRHD